jgi:hypothetical protein
MDHNFGCAFTRQSPVGTDARSLSSKWFAPSRHKPRTKVPVRLKTRGTTPKASVRDGILNLCYGCERALIGCITL